MKKIVISIIMCMLCCALAGACAEETVIPQAVQDFYDEMNEQLQSWGIPPVTAEITVHQDVSSYVSQFDSELWPLANSRKDFDTLYCWKLANCLNITVAYIGERPAAFILDSNGVMMRGGVTPYMEALLVMPQAYESLYPGDREGFQGDLLVMDNLLAYDDQLFKQDRKAYDNELVSMYRYAGVAFDPEIYCLQILPYTAYEGADMTAEQYHEAAFEAFCALKTAVSFSFN